jgi:hypothetical protein
MQWLLDGAIELVSVAIYGFGTIQLGAHLACSRLHYRYVLLCVSTIISGPLNT